jgi:hypothetical protein
LTPLNLLSNAVKFTDNGGITVSVDVAPAPDAGVHATITVEDTGIGLSELDMQRLFMEFAGAERRQPGGTGRTPSMRTAPATRAKGSTITWQSPSIWPRCRRCSTNGYPLCAARSSRTRSSRTVSDARPSQFRHANMQLKCGARTILQD